MTMLMKMYVAAIVVGGMVCGLSAQKKPDFSGTWKLVSTATSSGTGRGTGDQRAGGRDATNRGVLAGAAFNCGAECSIVQNEKQLILRRSSTQRSVTPSEIVLNFDGNSEIPQPIDGGRPSSKLIPKTKWVGNKLVVTCTLDTEGRLTLTQTISIETGKLTVMNSYNVEGTTPFAYTYAK